MGEYKIWIELGIFFGLCAMRLKVKSWILRLIFKVAICCVLIFAMNTLLPQNAIQVNGYTVGFSAILGIPGVMTMYVINMMI